MRANSSKAREKVDSCGTCQGSFQPQMRRNCASLARATSNCLVRANPYTALATKALAMAKRSLDGRPIQPRLEGTKRASGIISRVATSRLAGSVNSPSSSFKTGKSPVCSTWANCVICWRSVSFIWAFRGRCFVSQQQLNSARALFQTKSAGFVLFQQLRSVLQVPLGLQRGECAICKTPGACAIGKKGHKGGFHIDHDDVTRVSVRGTPP